MVTTLLMLLAGVGLAVWNIWQRRGRSARARSWARSIQGDWKRRSVLVVRPLMALVLVLGALVTWVDEPGLGGGTSGATVVLGLATGLCLLLLGAYLVLPLPVPPFLQPGWYRRQRRSQAGNRGSSHVG